LHRLHRHDSALHQALDVTAWHSVAMQGCTQQDRERCCEFKNCMVIINKQSALPDAMRQLSTCFSACNRQ
jgi:hypothetical protein